MNSFLGSSLILMSMASSQGGRRHFLVFLAPFFSLRLLHNRGGISFQSRDASTQAHKASPGLLLLLLLQHHCRPFASPALSCGRMHRPQGSKQQKVPAVSSVFIITIIVMILIFAVATTVRVSLTTDCDGVHGLATLHSLSGAGSA